MREQPQHMIEKDAMKVWRIHAGIFVAIFCLLDIAGFVLSIIFDVKLLYAGIGAGIGILLVYLLVYLIPKLRYRRWRYEIFEQEIYIQHGVLIMTRTIIPMIRVQHVDSTQGPILKKFKLASITISTAAGSHEVPALLDEDASYLRDRISILARVDEDDV